MERTILEALGYYLIRLVMFGATAAAGIEKIKNSNVEKKNKELYKNAADVPDDDFFTNDEVKEEANTEN